MALQVMMVDCGVTSFSILRARQAVIASAGTGQVELGLGVTGLFDPPAIRMNVQAVQGGNHGWRVGFPDEG